MGITKLLLLVGAAYIVYLLFRNFQRSLNQPGSGTPAQRGPEDMVKCSQCGVNVPRSEAIFSQGEFFCTPEHQRLRRK